MKFIVDEKKTIWRRTWVEIDSEDALEKCKNEEYDKVLDSIILDDTEEPFEYEVDPIVKEIYNEEFESLYTEEL